MLLGLSSAAAQSFEVKACAEVAVVASTAAYHPNIIALQYANVNACQCQQFYNESSTSYEMDKMEYSCVGIKLTYKRESKILLRNQLINLFVIV